MEATLDGKKSDPAQKQKSSSAVPAYVLEKVGQLGTVVDVRGDGNCGYHVLQMGLHDLKENYCSDQTTSFRKGIRDYAESNKTMLLSNFSFTFRTEGKEDEWWSSMVNRIYEDGVEYNGGANQRHWIIPGFVLPIVCFKYKVDIILYTLVANGDFTIRFTMMGNKVDQKREAGIVPLPADVKQSTLAMVHCYGNHYMYIAP